MKRCTRCETEKPMSEFHAHRGVPGGYVWCKPCSAAYRRQRYRANQAQVSADSRAWYEANRERKAATRRAWYEAHADKWADYVCRRRAAIHATAIGPVDFDALWTGCCGICGGDMDRGLPHPDPFSKSLDHIVPLARGGAHVQDNLQWAHLVCNKRKGARRVPVVAVSRPTEWA